MRLEDWNKALIWESEFLMNKYYSIGSAMEKAWDRNYPDIIKNEEIDISELRNLFWTKGLKSLKKLTKKF